MLASFVELPPFERVRKDYLDDDAYRALQQELLNNPAAGDVIEGISLYTSRFAPKSVTSERS